MNQAATDNFETLDQRIHGIASGVISDASHFLVDVVVRGVRGSRVVEVFIDGDDGVSISMLAKYSREISFMLDTEDFIDGKYKLEVSSPGASRPLLLLRQYKKHMDRKLKVKSVTSEGNQIQEGTLTNVGDDFIELTFAIKQSRKIMFSEILESKVILPW